MQESNWPNCPRYFNSDFDNLKYQFPGSENIANNYAQSMQDMFVLSMLDGKKNGVYVDWREPNVMRLAPTPLYNSYEDIARFYNILCKCF